jgi:hypothetical protein
MMASESTSDQNTKRNKTRNKGNRKPRMSKKQREFKDMIPERVIADFKSIGITLDFARLEPGKDIEIAEVVFTDDCTPRQQTKTVPDEMQDLPGVHDGVICYTPDEVIYAHLDDAYETLVQPGSVRYRPTGHQFVVILHGKIYRDRKGNQRRRSIAFPLDARDLSEDVYVPLSRIKKMVILPITFMPINKVGRGGKVVGVDAFAVHPCGKFIFLYSGYTLEDDEWATPIPCQMLERRGMFLAVPLRKGVNAPSEEEMGTMADQLQTELAKQESIDTQLQEHEFLIDGKMYDAYKVLRQFGVTCDSTLEEVKKARNAMVHEWHPDTGTSINRWRRIAKTAVPPREIAKVNMLYARFTAAFNRMFALLDAKAKAEAEEALKKAAEEAAAGTQPPTEEVGA